jgi:hypothetical protein
MMDDEHGAAQPGGRPTKEDAASGAPVRTEVEQALIAARIDFLNKGTDFAQVRFHQATPPKRVGLK